MAVSFITFRGKKDLLFLSRLLFVCNFRYKKMKYYFLGILGLVGVIGIVYKAFH
jgi:hypothetical protein